MIDIMINILDIKEKCRDKKTTARLDGMLNDMTRQLTPRQKALYEYRILEREKK